MKITFFSGPECSGKTKVATAIAEMVGNKEKTVWIDSRNFKKHDSFFLGDCNVNTELVIFDNFSSNFLDFLLDYVYNGKLKVEKKFCSPFFINANIIITTTDDIDINSEKYTVIKFPIH